MDPRVTQHNPPSPSSSGASPLPPDSPARPNARVLQTDRKARFSGRLFKAGLVLMAVLLFGLVSWTQSHLNVARDTLGLTRVTPLENAPPVLAFTTVALGGFRGLIANLLWIRASDLQEQDKYFEMVQLADWITKLQPHFVSVWVHQAWNMAYNISIKFTDPADRWQWVQRGLELLRDEGLKYNPNEPLIYRELAWFFQHKMGADLDDAHNYYKASWVDQMNELFGRGRPDFDALINPRTLEDQERATILRERFKINPEWMKETDERYGPLVWQLPESHAIYWAYVAVNKTDPRKLKKEDLLACRRVIFQSLQLSFRRGRLVYPHKDSDVFVYAPNVDIVPQADKAYLEIMELEPEMHRNISQAHRNFIRWAVYYLYVYGRQAQANYWWNYLKETYPESVPPGLDLEQYALDRAQETMGETGHDDAKAVIVGFVRQGFFSAAMGEDARALSFLRFAELFRNRFQEAVGPVSIDRVGLPELSEIKRGVLDEMLDPETGLDPVMAAQLRTNLGLPAPSAGTNQPTAAATAPAPGSPAVSPQARAR